MRIPAILLMALALAASVAQADTADEIIIKKSERTLTLMQDGTSLHAYLVSLGPDAVGAKTRQGDGKTPEGHYTVDGRNAQSHYHRSLHLSYPNAVDRKRAAKLGVNPGGDIMIHGLPNGYGYIGKKHLLHDWTAGCIAVTDEEMDEIWKSVGTPVTIEP